MGITVARGSINPLRPPALRSTAYPAAPSNLTAVQVTLPARKISGAVTAMSYNALEVTLTASNTFAVGDAINVSNVNVGFTVTNIDGLWTCKAGTNSTTIKFDVSVQPTGTTPQTLTPSPAALAEDVPVGPFTSYVRLSWKNNATNQTGFLIQRHQSTDTGYTWDGVWTDITELADTSAKNATVTYNDMTAVIATTCNYQVLAVNRIP